MPIEENAEEFAGLKIEDYDPATGLKNVASTAYRIRTSYDGPAFDELLKAFLADGQARSARALVVGLWTADLGDSGSSAGVVKALVAAKERLPALRSLFLGDITFEECEISWIKQDDLSPLLDAFPKLEHLRVRGGEGLEFKKPLKHAALRSLVIETGGLSQEVVRSVAAAELPQLAHLELWLGDDNYGATAKVVDLAPILSGKSFPKLGSLGLKDSHIQDDVARAVARSAILERLEALDLSLGTLSDQGLGALLAAPGLKKLKSLDIHHHYCTPELVKKLEKLGIPQLDVSEAEEPDGEDRYVAVGE